LLDGLMHLQEKIKTRTLKSEARWKQGEYSIPEFGPVGLLPRYHHELFTPSDHPIQRFASVKPSSPTQTPPATEPGTAPEAGSATGVPKRAA
jgi:hypothetical protein